MLKTVIYVEAICIPTISSPIFTKSPISIEGYEHLSGLQLADSFPSSHEVDVNILVGLDYYYSFIENIHRTGKHGLVAIRSIF